MAGDSATSQTADERYYRISLLTCQPEPHERCFAADARQEDTISWASVIMMAQEAMADKNTQARGRCAYRHARHSRMAMRRRHGYVADYQPCFIYMGGNERSGAFRARARRDTQLTTALPESECDILSPMPRRLKTRFAVSWRWLRATVDGEHECAGRGYRCSTQYSSAGRPKRQRE